MFTNVRSDSRRTDREDSVVSSGHCVTRHAATLGSARRQSVDSSMRPYTHGRSFIVAPAAAVVVVRRLLFLVRKRNSISVEKCADLYFRPNLSHNGSSLRRPSIMSAVARITSLAGGRCLAEGVPE